MKSFALFLIILITGAFAQSGRRAPKTIAQPTPTPEPIKPVVPTKASEEPLPVTAEKNEDYRCTNDGSLAHILDKDADLGSVLTAKTVDTRAVILEKPNPSYTKEARRVGVQGNVVLKVLLAANGEVGRVRVMRRLPYGLTENAMRAACKIKFTPAVKDGQAVSQWLDVVYPFRLADSSIYRR